MIVDYRAVFSIKTSEGVEPPSLETVQAMLVLALMRSEVWLIQELDDQRGDLEISLNRLQIHDWNLARREQDGDSTGHSKRD